MTERVILVRDAGEFAGVRVLTTEDVQRDEVLLGTVEGDVFTEQARIVDIGGIQ